jgi:hypothetical protein
MKTKILSFALVALLLLTSCASKATPEPIVPTAVDIGAVQTAAVETVVAAVTQTAETFTATPAPTEPPAPTAAPTETPTPAGTATLTVCDNMQFLGDVSIPDGTEFAAGAEFVKTWKVKNTGSCTWNTSYTVVFGYGSDNVWAARTTPLTAEVLPGQEAEISIALKAPTKPGTYNAWYRLNNNNGYKFGEFFSVVIVVK